MPLWDDKVSTTLDFARRMLVVETDGEREIARREAVLGDGPPECKARRILNLGVRTVLCGALSQSLARSLGQAGIEVIPYVSGPVDDVVAAYLCDRLAEPRFLQAGRRPGARRRWQQRGGFSCGHRRWERGQRLRGDG